MSKHDHQMELSGFRRSWWDNDTMVNHHDQYLMRAVFTRKEAIPDGSVMMEINRVKPRSVKYVLMTISEYEKLSNEKWVVVVDPLKYVGCNPEGKQFGNAVKNRVRLNVGKKL